ncbi:MAG: hypothetical protein CL610_04120 [Anaerolineaceae bacterium]|nr:hypothetical protein [Anaerolineaceae bacterium]
MVVQTDHQSQLERFGFSVWSGRSAPDHGRPHRHNEIELNYVEQGAVTYLHAGTEITIQACESAVFWGAVPHQLVYYEPSTVIDIATVPLEDVLQWDLPQPFLLDLLAGVLLRAGHAHLQTYGAAMYRQWQIDCEARNVRVALMEIRAFFHRFALHVQPVERTSREPYSAARMPDKGRQMAQFMSSHFQQTISVGDVAAVVGLHPHYAMSVFRQTFDMTIIDYLTQQRIAYAQQMLLTTNAKIIDIANDAGFQTVSHFYAAFKRLCGTSPGKYRAALRRHD